jgi:dolichol kinase
VLILFEFLRHSKGTLAKVAQYLFNYGIRQEEQDRIYTASMFFILSSMIALTLFELPYGLAAISIVAFGDTFATLIGRRFGTHPWWFNESKTIEGSIAGMIVVSFSLIILGFSPIYLIPIIACVGMLFESLPVDISDNILIPLAFVLATKTFYSVLL